MLTRASSNSDIVFGMTDKEYSNFVKIAKDVKATAGVIPPFSQAYTAKEAAPSRIGIEYCSSQRLFNSTGFYWDGLPNKMSGILPMCRLATAYPAHAFLPPRYLIAIAPRWRKT